jgi:hypothetical protein
MSEPALLAERAAAAAVGTPRRALAWLLPRLASACESTWPQARAGTLELALVVLLVAIGAGLRLWGLGAIGLHGDEKTMALPVMHIVAHGSPRFPSGMFYTRGIGQLYLMAGSVELFGQSEWSFRLPSALCGVLLIALAYAASRRFLSAPWRVAFTATVALLPAFIEDAQTARMYVFLVTSVAAYSVLIFRWERTTGDGALLGALAVMIVGLQFHTLAIFAAFLLLYPGIVRGDQRKLVLGGAAFIVAVAAFYAISHWNNRYFPETTSVLLADQAGPKAAALIPRAGPMELGAAVAVAVALGLLVAWGMSRAAPARRAVTAGAAGAVVAAGIIAQVLSAYHLAALLFAGAIVLAARGGARAVRWLVPVAAVSAAILGAQLWTLHTHAVPLRQAAGALIGWPSIWPQIAIAHYSAAATLACGAMLIAAIWLLARRAAVPDFVLFLALGAWIPLLLIGLFRWDIPPRYAAAQVFPLLLAAFAAAQWAWCRLVDSFPRARGPAVSAIAAAVACALAVDLIAFARGVGGGYTDHPDHAGAAAFIRSQHLGPRDIVIAEDVIVQAYYLGHVDYWLIGKATGMQFAREVDGRLEDMYTDVPLITTAAALERLIARRDRGAIYIIGSGEQQEDGRAFARGPSLERFLTSPSLPVVYVGRDGLTRVWKIPAPPGG